MNFFPQNFAYDIASTTSNFVNTSGILGPVILLASILLGLWIVEWLLERSYHRKNEVTGAEYAHFQNPRDPWGY